MTSKYITLVPTASTNVMQVVQVDATGSTEVLGEVEITEQERQALQHVEAEKVRELFAERLKQSFAGDGKGGVRTIKVTSPMERPRFIGAPVVKPTAAEKTNSRYGKCPCGSGKKFKFCCGAMT